MQACICMGEHKQYHGSGVNNLCEWYRWMECGFWFSSALLKLCCRAWQRNGTGHCHVLGCSTEVNISGGRLHPGLLAWGDAQSMHVQHRDVTGTGSLQGFGNRRCASLGQRDRNAEFTGCWKRNMGENWEHVWNIYIHPFCVHGRRLAGVMVPARRTHLSREIAGLMALFQLLLASNRQGGDVYHWNWSWLVF